MNALQDLQRWYRSQCDGVWEHTYGLTVATLDNPGWSVEIALTGTPLAGQPFAEVKRLEHKTDWIHCRAIDGKFEGHGGPLMLEEILRLFLAWASERQDGQLD